MNKLLGNVIDITPAATKLDFATLFEMAKQLGDVGIGGTWGQNTCDLKVEGCDGDYLSLRGKKYLTLKQNLSHVIRKAEFIKKLYKDGFE